MSQLPTGGMQPLSISRNVALPLPRQGLRESLVAPGVTPVAPVSNDNQLNQLFGLLEAAGQFSRVVGNAAQEKRHHQERQQEKVRLAEEGLASREASARILELEQAIASGELVIPDDADPRSFADALILHETKDQTVEYGNHFARLMQPRIMALVQDRQATTRDASDQELLTLAQERMLTAQTPEEVNAVLGDVSKALPRLTERDRLAALILPMAEYKARAGDAGGVDIAAAMLGENFPDKVQEFRAKLAATQASQRAALRQTQAEQVERLAQQGAPLDRFKVEVNKLTALSDVDRADAIANYESRLQRQTETRMDEDLAASLLNADEPEHAFAVLDLYASRVRPTALLAARDKVFARLSKHYVKLAKSELLDRAVTLAHTGDAGGSSLLRDQTIITPSGSQVVYTREQQLEDARLATFAEIDRQAPAVTPAGFVQNTTMKFDWLRQNPEARAPELAALWTGARNRISATATDETIAPASVAAFEMYRQMAPQFPGVMGSLLNDEDAEFYRLADTILTGMRDVSPANAMILASRAMTAGVTTQGLQSVRVDRRLLDKAVESIAEELDVEDTTHIRASVEHLARLRMQVAGVSDDVAVQKATEHYLQDHAGINGYTVNKKKHRVVDSINMESVAQTAIAHYVQKFPGERAENYTLRPDPITGNWRITFMDTGVPAEGSPVFTDGDLVWIERATRHPNIEESVRKLHAETEKSRSSTFFLKLQAVLDGVMVDLPPARPTRPAPIQPLVIPDHLKELADFAMTRERERIARENKPFDEHVKDAQKNVMRAGPMIFTP